MDDCQISALEGMVNLGSDGAAGGGSGLAFGALDDRGGDFTGFLTAFEGVAFCGAREGRLAVLPTGDGGGVVAPVADPEEGPPLVAFGT